MILARWYDIIGMMKLAPSHANITLLVPFTAQDAFYDDNLESVNGSSPIRNCSNTSLSDSNRLMTC